MIVANIALCILAVMASSSAQLFIKAASNKIEIIKVLFFLGMAGLLFVFSALTFIWVLRTLQLSQLMPLAALAYIFVPLGSNLFFSERLQPNFWLGMFFIVVGLIITSL